MGDGEIDKNNPQGQIPGPAVIYATKETAVYLKSIGVDPTKIPALNGKNILFVQSGDVTPGTAGTDKHADSYARASVTGSALGPNLTARSAEYFGQVVPRFVSQAVPELKDRKTPPLTILAEDLADDNKAALKGDSAQADPKRSTSLCTVALVASDISPERKFAGLAGLDIDPSLIRNVPGTTADWANQSTNHELGHCADPAIFLNGDSNTAVLSARLETS